MSPVYPEPQTPNADWEAALAYLQTLLPDDLFHLVEKSSLISDFVSSVFCQYPKNAATALLWQTQHIDSDVKKQLTTCFSQWCDAGKDIDEIQMSHLLRRFRRSHAAALAVLELTDQMSIESTCWRISALADCLIEAAYHWSYRHLQSRFGMPYCDDNMPQNMLIVAMGKLGGMELNFSSDVDLVFFYPQAGKTNGTGKRIENARFFQRLSTLLIKLLDQVTADGFVYRIDMRLRPYGDSGALVMSFAQAEDYYQEQGREWERFAMLRARILTGTRTEQKQLNEIISSFSFRRYIDYGVIESIRNMKEMIQREVRRKGLVGNIKLGAGGIREIEFMVQSLQLIQGGRDKRLREKNTLLVLPLLVEAKLLPLEVSDDLISAYRFLRRLEHCIQELAEKQTQLLPTNDKEQKALCLALSFACWEDLQNQVQSHQKIVNGHFSELFGESRQKALVQDDFYLSLAEGHISASELYLHMQAKSEATQCSFSESQSEAFINYLESFCQDAAVVNLSSRGAMRLKTFFPALLATCLLTESPDITLERLLKVLSAILKRTAYLELLSENPPVLQHLVDLVGRSPWVANRLADYPVLLDELLYPNSLYEPLLSVDLQSELQQSLLRIDPLDEEQLLDTLRAFKQTNELRIAAALLAERLSISQVSRYLTELAEVILQATVKQCWHLLQLKYGVPESLSEQPEHYGFAVVGYGKLGGFELGFGSDLDLVFLFAQPVDEQTNGQRQLSSSRFYTRLAQKIIHFLSTRTNLGMLYEVDMRLRPSGSSGLLVSHIDAYRDYQLESAWTWEHQALVRARFVAGDESLKSSFERVRCLTLGKNHDLQKLQQDVVEMRQKMRSQLEVKQIDKVDLKQTAGGLVDIEFIAQYFCLAYQGEKCPPNNTVEGIKLAQVEKMLTQEESLQLIKSYRLFRNKLNEMALLSGDKLIKADTFSEQRGLVKDIWNKVLKVQ